MSSTAEKYVGKDVEAIQLGFGDLPAVRAFAGSKVRKSDCNLPGPCCLEVFSAAEGEWKRVGTRSWIVRVGDGFEVFSPMRFAEHYQKPEPAKPKTDPKTLSKVRDVQEALADARRKMDEFADLKSAAVNRVSDLLLQNPDAGKDELSGLQAIANTAEAAVFTVLATDLRSIEASLAQVVGSLRD